MVSGKLHLTKSVFPLFSQCNNDQKIVVYHCCTKLNGESGQITIIPRPELRGFWGKIPLPDQNLVGISNRRFWSLEFAWALYSFKLFQSPITMPNMGSRRCSYEQATVGDGLLWALRNNIYETNIYFTYM